MLVVVVDVVCPDWSGIGGFQASVRGWPESWMERDVIAPSPMFEIWIVRLGDRLSCSRLILALKWWFVVRRVEPPVWTAMSVWEQSTLLVRA
jgi:hypothetical protein